MSNIRELKAPIRAFMQAHYTDERLAQLLCHARDGKLAFRSCCCFIGSATANHALRPAAIDDEQLDEMTDERHLRWARRLDTSIDAETAFRNLTDYTDDSDFEESETKRRRILIPMIRAEMKRRARRPAEPSDFPSQTSDAGSDIATAPVFGDKFLDACVAQRAKVPA